MRLSVSMSVPYYFFIPWFCRYTVLQYCLECLCKSLKNKGYIPEATLWKLIAVIYECDSIAYYEYLCEFEAEKENVLGFYVKV